uniref:ATP synthase subunit a n=1 Tax=Cryptotympana atrata TaxID=678702 RepID=A0A344ALE1_9HEMI|nr:ATP synthase F0 subunit 6 [Cryptotympana atrata]AFY16771.1 ATP synthase F0 subunit 6 [Cryptotympana atrata]AWV83189.1 ATP synthase F0 subunit 6 [Cryptotympana atrata]QUV77444.1 ATP synthase F0 subunit 6 [Cryptotympana atrata]
MMTNLFSSFDPSTGFMSLNWFSSMLFLGFFPFMYWYIPNRNSMFLLMVSKYLNKEFNLLIGSKSMGSSLIFMSMFIFIFYNNFIGLMPYVFTSSSHMVFTMSLALPMWMSFMLYGWINNMNHMFCHLVPMGTPFVLMPFMVFIETISNIIRPGSLAVRLSANMIAGHLLMTLLGNSSIDYLIYSYLILLIQMMLVLFELAVCIIQSYVFTILSTLYSNEVV